MIKMRMISTLALSVILAAGLGGPARAQAPDPNLLANPGFDEPWSKRYDGCKNAVLEEVQVPWGWDPYYVCQSPEDPPNINRTPEYRMVGSRDYPDRVHSGATALRYFNFWALNRSAGVFQVVNDVAPGSRLRFGLWVQLWTSDVDAQPPNSQEKPGNLEARVCIDQDGGGLDFNDSNLVCSAWSRPWDRYEELAVEGIARGGQVIVVLNTRAEFPVKHNDVQADDATLVVTGRGSVSPSAAGNAPAVAAPAGDVARIAVRNAVVNLRAAPSTAAKILGQVKLGEVLDVKARSSDRRWWQVTYRDGLAWIIAASTVANNAASRVPVLNVPVPPAAKATPKAVPPPRYKQIAE
ncbi:MAG: SH3 domain-containing protein [Chloroflexi bacterium]|nr:SH3 domain-containing protein [Chloroflexota bacterium]